MDEERAALIEEHAALDTLVSGLTPEQWRLPSACAGWDLADVLVHLSQTDGMAVASLEGRMTGFLTERLEGLAPAPSIDDSAAAMVANERPADGAAALERWRAASRAVDAGLAAIEPRARVTWVAGTLTARTLAVTRLAECWIHAGDVAAGLGVSLAPTDRLRHISRLAWRTLPHAFGREGLTMTGPVAFHLTGPGGVGWDLVPDEPATTIVAGTAADLCAVASRRVASDATDLVATGPDAAAVLALVRTWA